MGSQPKGRNGGRVALSRRKRKGRRRRGRSPHSWGFLMGEARIPRAEASGVGNSASGWMSRVWERLFKSGEPFYNKVDMLWVFLDSQRRDIGSLIGKLLKLIVHVIVGHYQIWAGFFRHQQLSGWGVPHSQVPATILINLFGSSNIQNLPFLSLFSRFNNISLVSNPIEWFPL